jgi:hypothetical protein
MKISTALGLEIYNNFFLFSENLTVTKTYPTSVSYWHILVIFTRLFSQPFSHTAFILRKRLLFFKECISCRKVTSFQQCKLLCRYYFIVNMLEFVKHIRLFRNSWMKTWYLWHGSPVPILVFILRSFLHFDCYQPLEQTATLCWHMLGLLVARARLTNA